MKCICEFTGPDSNPDGTVVRAEQMTWTTRCALHGLQFQKFERENARLNRLVDTILTDKNYEGGVQYWIRKHDDLMLTHLALINENAKLREALRIWEGTPD